MSTISKRGHPGAAARLAGLVLAATTLVATAIATASAGAAGTPVQRVLSPGGIEAWLIESHEIGLISMKFSFEGGALEDPVDKPGVAYFASYLFNEGAGPHDAEQLSRRRNRIGAEFYGSADHTNLTVSFSTPARHRVDAFELLRLAIQQPNRR
jgi:zinc protease